MLKYFWQRCAMLPLTKLYIKQGGVEMPHIHMYIPEREKKVRRIMASHGYTLDVIWALAELYPQYESQDIALISHLISEEEMALSIHVLPLEFVIDVGTQEHLIQDEDAKKLRDKIIKRIPDLRNIRFGVWIREMRNNGFYENKFP